MYNSVQTKKRMYMVIV